MQIARWCISAPLIALSLLIGLGQWWAIYWIPKQLNAQGQSRSYSMIPLVGGVLGVIGCLVSPLPNVSQLWWLPLIIDPGCALLFGCVAGFGIVAAAKQLFGLGSK